MTIINLSGWRRHLKADDVGDADCRDLIDEDIDNLTAARKKNRT
ncbi:hypothetical protein [Sulfuriflexus sp.]|nr:hypothetical protein [Sulfuriflexus sp.]